MLFNYTTELRTFFDRYSSSDPNSHLSHRELIELGRPKLFDFDYPIFDESYKNVFETHFIRHFYMRQIGFESFGLFKFQLESWLLINMPYWNKMFESELLKYDPLTNAKMNVTHNKRNDKTQNDTVTIDRTGETSNKQSASISGNTDSTQTKDETGSVTDDNFDRQIESNTPDGRLNLTANDGEGVIEYASSIKENTENNSKNTNINGTNTSKETSRVDSANDGTTSINDTVNQTDIKNINDVEDFVQERFGKIGVQTYPKMVQEYRQSLLRIEKQIFDEMNELFMLVY